MSGTKAPALRWEVMYNKSEIEKIKSRYSEKQTVITDYEKLKQLDKKAKMPATIFSYVFGIVGTLIMGFGMSICLGALLNIMWVGVLFGVIGASAISINYFIYKKLINKGKQKYSQEILDISSKLLNENE